MILKRINEKIIRFNKLHNPFSEYNKIQKKLFLENNNNLYKYNLLTESDIVKTKQSDTIVIFGSGYSLNDITRKEWNKLQQFDTIGFNWFVNQKFLKVKYLLSREIAPPQYQSDLEIIKNKYLEYSYLLSNEYNREAIIIKQNELMSVSTNRLLAENYLPSSRKLFLYKNKSRGKIEPPSNNFNNGLVHGYGTLMDVLNFVYLLGWKKVVFAGIDLYDRRYFWLGYNETREYDILRNAKNDDKHNTAPRVLQNIKYWKKFFENEGVNLSVINKRSLLTQIIDFKTIEEL